MPIAAMQILQVLRSETRVDHDRVERLAPFLQGKLTVAAYRGYLARLFGFYEPLEAALAAHDFAPAGIDLAARRKAHLLARDLGWLGLDDEAIAALPRCAAIPRPAALPEALGCAYVMEGATRGGLVIARQVGPILGIGPDRGGAFVAGYGAASEAMWRSFGARLAAFAGDAETGRRVVGAARETFHLLSRWLAVEDADGRP